MTAARKRIEDGAPLAQVAGAEPAPPRDYNLNGQKLGRKGRDTRERILAAAAELIATEPQAQVSLSAVARKASLGMTSLYNYFGDLTELVLAVLEPVMATAEDAFVGQLREYWPDDELAERCTRFVSGFYDFWDRHARLLHLRNNLADGHEKRMMLHRVSSSQPVIRLLVAQMDGDPEKMATPAAAMATVLMTGIERSITVTTDDYVQTILGDANPRPKEYYLWPVAKIMELSIREGRVAMRHFTATETS